MNYLKNYTFVLILILIALPGISLAATLSITPSTGVYSSGSTFVARVVVNTQNKPINAAEGTIKFNPQEITVVSVDRSNSIFNLWVTEPTFSNTAGTINFSGGLPSGYTGSSGSIFNITFRTNNAATARVSITGGSVLANDGMGTNILSGMNGGTYTVQVVSTSPAPEIIEYVSPPNTPGLPSITSTTHPDNTKWYQASKAELNWSLPSGTLAVRTLLDQSAYSVPTKVYEDPISAISLDELPEGVSYFHLQFKNAEGWGKVAHYRLAVDTQKPSSFTVTQPENYDVGNPVQVLLLNAADATSKVKRYMVKVDNAEPYEFVDEKQSNELILGALEPGTHSVLVEAFDEAANSISSTYTFTIQAFDKPIFTDYPSEINEEVIPVIKGLTRPRALVEVLIQKIGAEPVQYSLTADDNGVFFFIPEGTLSMGVYQLSATAVDEFAAKSEVSETIRIAVQQPGYIQVGSFLINVLSVVIPLIAMTVLLVLATWFTVAYLRRFRRKIKVESTEVVAIVAKEFSFLHKTIKEKQLVISEARKTKRLTKMEEDTFAALEEDLMSAQRRIEKEVGDIEKLVQPNN
jgi:hypothetical protein